MDNEINIIQVSYINNLISGEPERLKVIIDNETLFVPLAEGNRHYDEIMRQVNAGTLTIEEAE